MTAPPPQAFQKAAACNAGRMRLFQMKRSNQRQVRCVGQSVTTLPSHNASRQVLTAKVGHPPARRAEPRRVGALNRSGYTNGKEVDKSVARKAQQEREGKMEETETAAGEEAP